MTTFNMVEVVCTGCGKRATVRATSDIGVRAASAEGWCCMPCRAAAGARMVDISDQIRDQHDEERGHFGSDTEGILSHD